MYTKILAPTFVFLLACGSGNTGFEADGDNSPGFVTGNQIPGGNVGAAPGESILPPTVQIPATAPGTGVIYGKVINAASGAVVEGASVSSGAISSTSDADGAYMLVDVPFADRVIVNTEVSGYSEQSKIVVVSESQRAVILNPLMLQVGITQTFNPTADQTIEINTASISLPADSLVFLQNGVESPPVGQVTATLTNIDASSEPALLPGDYLIAPNTNIESFGAITVNMKDESGNQLDLADGSFATVVIPLANSTTGQNTANKLSYSTETGYFTDDNSISLTTDTYTGDVSNIATWNVGAGYSPVTISGCVDDGLGAALPGTVVRARGSDYIGTSSAIVGVDGTFEISAKANSTILLTASNQGKISNTVEVSTSSGATISDCLSIRDFSISITLTWGESPNDLDTHLVSPDYHVYYGSRGSLSDPPYAVLDVDDTSGFGPEVLTISQFTVPGNYVYSIHRFSSTGSIVDSPTRVTLNYNGDTFIFAPPSGEDNNRTWNVFEIIVDDNLAVEDIKAVQSWSTGAPQG